MYPVIPLSVGWPVVILLALFCIFLVFRGVRLGAKQRIEPSQIKSVVNDEIKVTKMPEDYIMSDMLSNAHKCSNCGWGFRVSLLNRLATCPKCGNVDRTRIVKL